MSNKYSVAFMIDGSFLPIRNGAYYSIYGLMNALANSNEVSPTALLCYRGWDDPKLYCQQSFGSLFIPANSFYQENGILEYALKIMETKFVHFYTSEETVLLGERLRNAGIKVIFEAINIDHVLYEGLGSTPDKVREAKHLQKKAMQLSDHVLCRSEHDKSHILRMGINRSKVSVYRGAIDTKAIRFTLRNTPGKRLVFLGHMFYPPNERALEHICKIMLPALTKIDKNYSLTILGITPEKTVRKYGGSHVFFKQGVSNLGDELASYDLAVVPLTEGSGTRLKVLDFMAAGIPIITTSIGVQGLQKSISDCLIIENTLEKYPAVINNLLNDDAIYQKLAHAGREYVDAHYDWENNLDPFLHLYQQLVKG